MSPAVFEAREVTYAYPGADRPAVTGVDLRIGSGSLYAIIGPNGSGKSTLLRLLLGARAPDRGRIFHGGRPLAEWSRRQLARRVGVVPQQETVAFPLSVREFVGMGRYPHLGAWRSERREDRRAIERAMDRCDVADLADRPFTTLSGGERQLARVARALAQRPDVLVLDEPTVSLDIRHEMEIFELLRELAASDAVTVVLVTHNLNAASRYASRLLLLAEGRAVREGEPRRVLTRPTVERVYGWPVRVAPLPGEGPDAGAPQVTPLSAARPTDGHPPESAGAGANPPIERASDPEEPFTR